jgi:hypothetical protein
MKRAQTHRVYPANQSRQHLVCKAQEGETFEDVKHPSYLWNIAHREGWPEMAQRWNDSSQTVTWPIVEIYAYDGSWRLTLMVLGAEVETQTVFSRVLAFDDWSDTEVTTVDLSGAVVEFGGPAHRWRVVLNGAVLKKGFTTEAEAIAWANARGAKAEPKKKA